MVISVGNTKLPKIQITPRMKIFLLAFTISCVMGIGKIIIF